MTIKTLDQRTEQEITEAATKISRIMAMLSVYNDQSDEAKMYLASSILKAMLVAEGSEPREFIQQDFHDTINGHPPIHPLMHPQHEREQ
ncbi:MAG: hypothetical protein K0U41_06850 [Gammaproteobacteria bacterium]|nr:hypothetical protein [Gammaproteobacteria bacterium]